MRTFCPRKSYSSNHKKENAEQIHNTDADHEPPQPLRREGLHGRTLAHSHPKRKTEPSDCKCAGDKHQVGTKDLAVGSRDYTHGRKAEDCEQTHQRAGH